MMLLAAGWTWPAALVGLTLISGVTLVLTSLFSHPATVGLPPARLDEIDDDLALIRADLADIKASLAELERLFKSVG